MILPDRHLATLRGLVDRDACIGPASVDLRLGGRVDEWPTWVGRDPRIDQEDRWLVTDEVPDGGGWRLRPNTLYRAATAGRVAIPPDCAGILEGRSSWARLGLTIHQTAGFLDPGYEGHPTLEISVVGAPWVYVPRDAAICQLIVVRLAAPAAYPYRGKYQGDTAPVGSRLYLEYRQREENDGP